MKKIIIIYIFYYRKFLWTLLQCATFPHLFSKKEYFGYIHLFIYLYIFYFVETFVVSVFLELFWKYDYSGPLFHVWEGHWEQMGNVHTAFRKYAWVPSVGWVGPVQILLPQNGTDSRGPNREVAQLQHLRTRRCRCKSSCARNSGLIKSLFFAWRLHHHMILGWSLNWPT